MINESVLRVAYILGRSKIGYGSDVSTTLTNLLKIANGYKVTYNEVNGDISKVESILTMYRNSLTYFANRLDCEVVIDNSKVMISIPDHGCFALN